MSDERMRKVIEEWTATAGSDWYMSSRTDDIIQAIINNPSSAFHPVTWKLINNAFPSLKGVKICVPSSGDNQAVFAFAALGADVVSCDICEKQLTYAREIAERFNLSITFAVQDTMKLTDIRSEAYDFVYTSEGVHVWMDDPDAMYRSIFRVLKNGGVYINYEIHPFNRPFDFTDAKPHNKNIVIRKPYECTGPFDEGVI